MCCCFRSGGLLTVPERCDVLTPICICFPTSSASLSNFNLRGSMLPNRFSRSWSNLSLSCDLGKGPWHLTELTGACYSWADLLYCIYQTHKGHTISFWEGEWCPKLAVSWKVVISLLYTSNLIYSCCGGLAQTGHNNQDTFGTPCCWELPCPCYMVIFSMHFADVKLPKQFPGFVCSFPAPGSC